MLGAASLELGTFALAVLALGVDLAAKRTSTGSPRRPLFAASLLGTAALLALSFRLAAGGAIGRSFVLDPFALLVKRLLLGAALLAIAGLAAHARRRGVADRAGEAIVLMLFATIGGMALVSARDWATLFVAFELLSIPLYVLVALEKERGASVEGAMKLFLFGSVSSAILLLGIALVIGASGSLDWAHAAWTPGDPLAAAAIAVLLAGFGFKIAIFPFSLWVPDTYQAAPAPIVAFVSVAPKAAAVAALFRLTFEVLLPASVRAGAWLAVLAAATMVVGNLLALRQSDLKRLLAYSGIAQIGYVLAALASASALGAGLSLFFFVAYLLSNAGAFLAVAALECAGEEATLHGCRGLVRRSPWLAGALVVFLLSLGGIPFVLGFWGKLYVFLAAAQAGLWWLVALGAVLSVVALYYYLNVARYVLIVKDDGEPLRGSPPLVALVVLCAALVAFGGLVPRVVVDPCLSAAAGLRPPPR